MNCDEVTPLLLAFLDGETAPADRERIDRHLKACPGCREELAQLTRMEASLRAAMDVSTAAPARPAETWKRIRERIRTTEPARTPAPFRLRREINEISKRWKMNLFGQPKWKVAMAGTALLALIVTLSLALPSFGGEEDMALAVGRLAQNSPEVKEACGGEGEVEIVEVSTYDGMGYVLCTTRMGEIINAGVDIEEMKVESVAAVEMPGLSETEKQKAVEIASASPAVRALLDDGASIGSVYPVYSFNWEQADTGQRWAPELELMTVEVYHADGESVTAVDVDLETGRVELMRQAWVIEEPGIGAEGQDLSDICVTTVSDINSTPPVLTDAERRQAAHLARSDERVQALLEQGAEISDFWGMYERNLVFLREEGNPEPIVSVHRKPLAMAQITLGEDIHMVKIDLAAGEVLAMDEVSLTSVMEIVERVEGPDLPSRTIEPVNPGTPE